MHICRNKANNNMRKKKKLAITIICFIHQAGGWVDGWRGEKRKEGEKEGR